MCCHSEATNRIHASSGRISRARWAALEHRKHRKANARWTRNNRQSPRNFLRSLSRFPLTIVRYPASDSGRCTGLSGKSPEHCFIRFWFRVQSRRNVVQRIWGTWSVVSGSLPFGDVSKSEGSWRALERCLAKPEANGKSNDPHPRPFPSHPPDHDPPPHPHPHPHHRYHHCEARARARACVCTV